MPRYCAVKLCRNRGGTASRQDNKRISFYPFPLQDLLRLQRWVHNMKRENWIPSRHQYLCSEHFTEDCFDIRWGIRYLKNTSVPTLFPPEDDGENKVGTGKRHPSGDPSSADPEADNTGCDSPLGKRPLIQSSTQNHPQSSTKYTQVISELPVVVDVISDHSNLLEAQTGAAERVGQRGLPTASGLPLSPCSEVDFVDQGKSTMTALCCDPLGPFFDQKANVVGPSLRSALGEALSFVPTEKVKDTPTGLFLGETVPVDGEHISQCEHSYCRPDANKDQLWRKILTLHAKILELDHREETTVAKIRELEHEITLLKRDGAAFTEKQKVLEDFTSSVII